MGLLVDLRFGVTKAYLAVITTQGTKTRGYYTVRVSKGADNFPLQPEDTHFGWLEDFDVETPNWKQAYGDFKARWKVGLLPPIYVGVYEEDGTPVDGFVGQDDINLARQRAAERRAAPSAETTPEERKFPAPDERLPLDAEAEAALTTDDLIRESDEVASDVISKLSREGRRRFTELLNVEMAELQLSRGGPNEDRKREQKIERLLGIFARAGEM